MGKTPTERNKSLAVGVTRRTDGTTMAWVAAKLPRMQQPFCFCNCAFTWLQQESLMCASVSYKCRQSVVWVKLEIDTNDSVSACLGEREKPAKSHKRMDPSLV